MKWTITISFLIVCAVYVFFISYGTGDFSLGGLRGPAYDSLARNLLMLDASVDYRTISWEAFNVNGSYYMYQGPFPALLRIPLNMLMHSFSGRWSQYSCLLGSLLAVLAFILSLCMLKEKNSPIENQPHKYSNMLYTLTFAFGTPFIYLVSSSRIYHEAVIWGLCGSLWAIFSLLCFFRTTHSHFFFLKLFSWASSVALLSRLTFGLPLLIISAFLVVSIVIGRRSGVTTGRFTLIGKCFLCSLPLIVAVAIQLWYNHERFGSIFKAINYQYFYHSPDENGGAFNLERLGSTLLNYLGFRYANFSAFPPYIVIAPVLYYVPQLFFSWHEQTTSLSIGSPWLVFSALGGVCLLIRQRRFFSLLCVLAFIAQAGVILGYDFVTERYTSEFIPFLVISFLLLLEYSEFLKKRTARLLLGILCLFSIFASVGTALSWQMLYTGSSDVPEQYTSELRRLFLPKFTVPEWGGKRINIEALTPSKVEFGFVTPQMNKSFDESELKMLNTAYSNGIGIHAPTTITYNVPEGTQAMQMVIGLADSALLCAAVSFEVKVVDQNGAQLYCSGVMGLAGAVFGQGQNVSSTTYPKIMRIALDQVKVISIVVDDLGNRDCDQVIIGSPEFLLNN